MVHGVYQAAVHGGENERRRNRVLPQGATLMYNGVGQSFPMLDEFGASPLVYILSSRVEMVISNKIPSDLAVLHRLCKRPQVT